MIHGGARTIEAEESAADFVIEITATWQKSVAAIIETGRLLIQAKKALKHGQWCEMFRTMHFKTGNEGKLPFTERVGQRLMKMRAFVPVKSDA